MPIGGSLSVNALPRQADHTATPSRLQKAVRPSNRLVSWLILVGIFLPAIQIDIGGLIWTPGRAVTILLLVPAVWVVLRRHQIFFSDFFVLMVSVWTIGSVLFNGAFRPSVFVDALELLSGYMIGRAYFDNPINLDQFVRVLKVVSIVLIILAMLDTASGRRLTADAVASVFSVQYQYDAQLRNGLARATSTFPTAELYGTFCAMAASIFLYSERTWRRKCLWAGLCIFGCALSVSSGPLLALCIVLFVFFYDASMRQYPWHWKALRISVIGILLCAFLGDTLVFGNDALHPIYWLVRNVTFSPWSGYFRVEEWQHAMVYIDEHPLIGMGYIPTPTSNKNDFLFLHSLDALYLVMMWRYGIPAAVFLLLAVFASFSGSKGVGVMSRDSYVRDIRTGFILSVSAVAIVAATVHLWDSTWIFFGICMGICASFKEYPRSSRSRPPPAELWSQRVVTAIER